MSKNIKKGGNNKPLRKFRLFFFLSIISIIVCIIAFSYVVVAKSRESSKNPYYKTSSLRYSEITVVTQKKQWTSTSPNDSMDLLAKKTVKETFIAQIDNLGIIAIPFDAHNRSINDKVVFRLKETNKKNWYFQRVYNADQFQTDIPFPFGFPVITNSKNISFTFEIESLNGTLNDSVSINKASSYFFAKYKFSKSELEKNPSKLIQFLVAKTIEQSLLLTAVELILILSSFLFSFIISLFLYKLINHFNIKQKVRHFLSYLRELIFNADNRKLLIKNIEDFLHNNSLLIIVIILLMTMLTRFSISYTDKSNILVPPDKIIMQPWIGGDFKTGVIKAVDLMLQGRNFYIGSQNLGSGFTLLTTPSIYLLSSFSICSIKDLASCSPILYHWLIFITLGGYLLLIFLISFKKKELLTFLLLYFILFLLDTFGSLGLERGNIDIILSLFFGLLMVWILLKLNTQESNFNKIFKSVIIGCICAFLVNTKFFLLPVGVVAIYSSRKMLVAFLSFVITFCLLGYLPNILFHSPSNPLSSINSAVHWGAGMFAPVYILRLNNTFNAIASLATNCVKKGTCDGQFDSLVISVISILLFIFTFIVPFLATRSIRSKLISFGKQINMGFKSKINYESVIILIRIIKSGIQWLNRQRFNKNFIMLLLILSVASLNLLPENSFGYRLYYSLPLLILLWKKTENNKQARIYCLLSIIFLSIKGLWIFTDVNPNGFNIFESRGMSFFVVLHYFFMIKTGIEMVVSKASLKLTSSRLNSLRT